MLQVETPEGMISKETKFDNSKQLVNPSKQLKNAKKKKKKC